MASQRASTSARRSVSLNVDPLEDRCTPAVSAGFVLLIQPPETVMVTHAVLLPAEPMLAVTGQTESSTAVETPLVRTDLFGSAGHEPSSGDEESDFAMDELSPFEVHQRHDGNAETTVTKGKPETCGEGADLHEMKEPTATCVVLEFDAETTAD